MRAALLLRILAIFTLILTPACSDEDGDTHDAASDNAHDGDHVDGIETWPDSTEDPLPDPAGDDPATDPVPDPVSDPTPDPVPDPVDVPVDGSSQCLAMGGYCISYNIESASCVTCSDVGDTHYKPAGQLDADLGCPQESDTTLPWCCVPVDTSSPSSCESGGGECYPRGGSDHPCPVGWNESSAGTCGSGLACCEPADFC
jgi:hypothetical protein